MHKKRKHLTCCGSLFCSLFKSMTHLPRTLKQISRLWFEISPEESEFFQREIEAASLKWQEVQATGAKARKAVRRINAPKEAAK